MIGKNERVITPLELHYGRVLKDTPMEKLLDGLEPKRKEGFRTKWNQIIETIDKAEREKIDAENEGFKKKVGYEVGDLVYLENNSRHKESLRFIRNLFVIIENDYRKFRIQPLFGNKGGGQMVAHANDLKAYNYSHLLNLLPSELKSLMGQNYSPEELKELVRKNPKFIPDELVPKHVIEGMQLRNRLSPRSVTSVPAILSSNTSYVSDVFRFRGDDWSEDESDSSFSSEIGNEPQHKSVSEGPDPPEEAAVNLDEISIIEGPKVSHTMMTTRTEPSHFDFSPEKRQSDRRKAGKTSSVSYSPIIFPDITSPEKVRPTGGQEARVDQGRQHQGQRVVSPKIKKGAKGRIAGWVKKTVTPVKDKIVEIVKSFRDDSKADLDVDREELGIPSGTIIYQAPDNRPKKKGVRFDASPVLRERVTRAGRQTKIPSRYLD
jgi:hypothetical protein